MNLRFAFRPLLAVSFSTVLAVACSNSEQDYLDRTCDPATEGPCPTGAGGTGAGTTTATGGGGSGGAPTGGGGTGGAPTCTDDPSLCTGSTPVCLEGSCVTCTAEEADACMGETPVCDGATNECRACAYHADCPQSACNPFTGACLDATPQTVGPSGADFPTLSAALASVAENGEAVFLLSPNTADAPYVESVSLASRTVAVLADGGRPALLGTGGPPTIQVFNGATLLLEGVDVTGNLSAPALQANGLVALDRVEVTQNSGGGIQASSTAELLVRSSIVAGNGATATSISLDAGSMTLLYSAVAGGFGTAAAITCSPGHDLTVRNSILFNRNVEPTLANCTNATITQTGADSTLAGMGNTDFGDPEQMPALFVNIDNGDLRLTAAGVTEFGTVAEWQAGDPPTDIDGGARPDTAGTADVAGAHLGP